MIVKLDLAGIIQIDLYDTSADTYLCKSIANDLAHNFRELKIQSVIMCEYENDGAK